MQAGWKPLRIVSKVFAMKQSADNRELITLEAQGRLARATYHRVPGEDSRETSSRVGIVFLNSLSVPRTATGDSAVYWADKFAECGYPSFRLDLPGLGDSEGDLPAELLDYINAGSLAAGGTVLVRELIQRFKLAGVVIVGHCAGAVSAIYIASSLTDCRGLVLLDPYFHLPQALRPRMRQKLSNWALHNSFGRVASNVYDLLRKAMLQLGGNHLPENANLGLLRRWAEVASSGMPILLFKAPARKAKGTNPRAGEFDYLAYSLKVAGLRSKVAVQFTKDTDHSFANRAGRSAVRQPTENWLQTHFPLERKLPAAVLSIDRQPALAMSASERQPVRHHDPQTAFSEGLSSLSVDVRSEITAQFRQVAREQDRQLAPLTDQLELLDSGLDSLSFAIVVTRLEESLGVDPFSLSEDTAIPVTFGDFVRFYENAAK
jgi:pimeloyl-ACP methyl ester carboxylesterase